MKNLIVCAIIMAICLIQTMAVPPPAGPSCGINGKVLGSNCLCAAFTQPNAANTVCTKGTGVCLNTNTSVDSTDVYTLSLKTRSLRFEGSNLVIKVEFPNIASAVTNIAIVSKDGHTISNLKDEIIDADHNLGTWSYAIENHPDECVTLVTWTVDWETFSVQVLGAEKKHYAFDIIGTSKLVRELSRVKVRFNQAAPSILVDVIPVTINLNQVVSTANFVGTTDMVLDYDVKMSYSLKKVHLDPSTLKMRVVLEHGISFPLSLKSANLKVTIDDQIIPSRSYEKVNKDDCPPTRHSTCKATTVIIFQLPINANCTNYQLNVGLDLRTKCKGINDNTSKYLCFGLKQTLKQRNVPVNIPISYNFCPRIETTRVSVHNFTLSQNHQIIGAEAILTRHRHITGRITLDVDRTFAGSVFSHAQISSIKILERIPADAQNPAFYEIKDISQLFDGQLINPTQIKLKFRYEPSYNAIALALPNWLAGIYFQVTVDVSYYSPAPVGGKRNEEGGFFKSVVRAEIPHPHAAMGTKDRVNAISENIKMDAEEMKKAEEEKKQAEYQLRVARMSEELQVMQKDNQRNLIVALASVGACLVVALVVVVVVVIRRRKAQNQN